jgi:hypothetical protein
MAIDLMLWLQKKGLRLGAKKRKKKMSAEEDLAKAREATEQMNSVLMVI